MNLRMLELDWVKFPAPPQRCESTVVFKCPVLSGSLFALEVLEPSYIAPAAVSGTAIFH